MIVTNAPFAPHHGAAHSRANSPNAEEGQLGPGTADGAPDAARTAGLADGDKGKSASSPAHQARALADVQAAQDGQHAKLPFGHIVRLIAKGDAGAAAALYAPQEPDGTDGVGEAAAVASTGEAGVPDDEDAAVAGAPSVNPDAGEQADPELAPELGVVDTLAASIDELVDAPAEDGDEAI